ncbi:MAG: glucose-phosphate cytidylyltransferase [Frankiales bacterium]|nr:glucose-phosphate cytidylyltransferase [Frankiales bacterium]
MPAPLPPVVVLCGGRGTRAWPLTEDLPKPLLPIGGRPVLGHLLEVHLRQGVRRIVLATGFRADLVEKWAGDLELPPGASVTCVDTGADAGTAERLRACRAELDDTFFATYGDGLGDVDLRALFDRHRAAATSATVTTVPLPSQYGTLDLDADDRVTGFREKPVLPDHWINAGFFVLTAGALDASPGPDLERDVLPALALRGELVAHRHAGFWRSVDTQKDLAELEHLAATGATPWLS